MIGLLVIPWLPRRAVVGLANALGALAWRWSPKLCRIADANLRLVFGDTLSPTERQAICRASFQSFALTLLDMFWFMVNTTRRHHRYVLLDESFMPLINHPPVIGVTGHFGNWEIMSAACGLHGAPLTAVAMPLKNRFVDRMLNRLRRTAGSQAVPRQGAVRALLKNLKNGRNIALVLDQNTLPREGGIFMPFLGLYAPVSNAAGLLWQRTGAPLLVTSCIADARGVYTARGSRLLPPPSGEGAEFTPEDVTALAVQEIEQVIRRYPSNWLWSYKRWCYYRDEDPVERYPFYARRYRPDVTKGK